MITVPIRNAMALRRNFKQEIQQVKDEIRESTDRLHGLLDEWAGQTERERLEWLESLKRAERRADHAEKQTSVVESALMFMPSP